MRLVHSFLFATSSACAFVNAYDSQAHVQQPYEIVTTASAPYTCPSKHDDVISTPSFPQANVAEPTPFGIQLPKSGVVHDGQTNSISQAEGPTSGPATEILFFLAEVFSGSSLATPNGTTDITWTEGSVTKNRGSADGVVGFVQGLSQFGSVFIAVFTFVCLESLLSHAMIGKTPLSLMSGRIKNTR